MKKLFYLCIIFSCLLNSYKLQAQLLKAGDAVVSVSPGLFALGGTCGPSPTTNSNYPTDTVLTLVKICRAPSNTIGSCWNMTGSEYSTLTYKHPDWIRNKLGNIFGICIDDSRNIYVTSTGFYGAQYSGISSGSVFKINANTGNVTLLRDLHAGNTTAPESLGNIKFFAGHLFVSDLLTNMIYMLDPVSGITIATYNPNFGANSKPCGLAIRNLGGSPRLYFSRNDLTTTTITSIYSIDILGAAFGSNLIQEIPPGLLNTPYPITDLAFTKNFDKLLFVERSTTAWGSTTWAHQSKLYEFNNIGGTWINANPNYYVGIWANHTNSSGGISFSQSVIGSDCNKWGCDTTIVATSDAIFIGGPPCGYTYGITAFKHANGSGSNSGVNFDINNQIVDCPKTFLGDVEICDTTIACSNCACGQWGPRPIGLTLPGSPVSLLRACGSSQSFTSGQVGGLLNVSYICEGNCNRTIAWQLINTVTNLPVSNGNANVGTIDLSQFNNLPCGSYKFIFTPTCGNTTCPPCEFFINIVCDPPPCCPPQTQVTIQPQNANYSPSPNPNAWGTYSQSFILNSNVPMSEIRIDVEHFELNSPDPDCIPCKNMPKTWGSLLGAAYNGNGFVTPVNSLPFTGSILGNGRELVYKPGSLITINNGVVNVNIAMPNASPIDCCVLTANICLKFTFKDANCRECTYLYCNQNIEIKQSVNGNPNGNQLKNVNKTVQKSVF
jgi:hypothetical protein